MFEHIQQSCVRIVDHLDCRVHDLGEIVRRNIGRHAHRDSIRTIHNQVRNPRWKHRRLKGRLVVVRNKIHRLHVDVGQHLAGDPHHAALGVAHRRGHVAVDGTEVALPVDQRVAKAKRLGHAHQGVVDRRVAVRMVDAHRLADHLGALVVALVVLQPHLIERVQNAPVHRLQPVAHIGQRPSDDDRHRVREIGTAHLLFDIDRDNARRAGRPASSATSIIPAVTAIGRAQRKQGIFVICHSWVPPKTFTFARGIGPKSDVDRAFQVSKLLSLGKVYLYDTQLLSWWQAGLVAVSPMLPCTWPATAQALAARQDTAPPA